MKINTFRPNPISISLEAGFYYFAPRQSHLVFVPFLAGYRHTLDNSGAGFYAAPFAGYSIGASDIQRALLAGKRLKEN